jgi:hypothetical protein
VPLFPSIRWRAVRVGARSVLQLGICRTRSFQNGRRYVRPQAFALIEARVAEKEMSPALFMARRSNRREDEVL